jgi:hypothetical protein
MKLSNWFKILWWFLITVTAVDVFFFAIWIALMLVPLFQEVSFLGVKFKQEVEGLKAFVATQVGDMRNELGMPSRSRRRSVPT